jgi:hypothetical protein
MPSIPSLYPPLPDWRAILAPAVQLMPDEEATMDELARTHPEMVVLICKRMRLAADNFFAVHGKNLYGENHE